MRAGFSQAVRGASAQPDKESRWVDGGRGCAAGVGVCGRGGGRCDKTQAQVRQVFLSERDTMRAATVTAAPALVILVALFSCLAVVGVERVRLVFAAARAVPRRVRLRRAHLHGGAPTLRRTTRGARRPRDGPRSCSGSSPSPPCAWRRHALALTYAASDSASRLHPVLYRWSFSASVYFLVLLSLLGLVPCCGLSGRACARPPRCACSGASGAAGRAPHGRAAAP